MKIPPTYQAQPIDHQNYWLIPFTFFLSYIVLYFAAMPLLDDPDMPWHLATGALLLDTHSLPATDPWSFASNNAPWYLMSWLWNVILGGINSIFGHIGIFLFAIALYASVMAAQAWRLLYLHIDRQAVILTLMLMLLCMVEFASARPQIAGYVMIVAFQHLLHVSRTSKRYGGLLALPVCMLAWVNMHGSFIAGFTLLGAYIIDAYLSYRYRWGMRLLIISAACAVAALINPYGIEIITGAMQSIDSDAKSHLIEWKPFSLGTSIGLSAWVVVFVIAANFRNRDVPVADKLISLAWLIATLLIMRNGAIFVLVSAPYLASCLDVQTRGLRENPNAGSPPAWVRKYSYRQLWGHAMAAVLIFMVVSSALDSNTNRIQSDKHSIRDAIHYIKTSKYKKARYLSDFDFGGQIIYFGQGIKFFMDSRSNTAYGSREMNDYLAFWLQKPGWQQRLTSYGINGIIAHKGSRFAQAYAENQYTQQWHLVFAGKVANVYIAAPKQ